MNSVSNNYLALKTRALLNKIFGLILLSSTFAPGISAWGISGCKKCSDIRSKSRIDDRINA